MVKLNRNILIVSKSDIRRETQGSYFVVLPEISSTDIHRWNHIYFKMKQSFQKMALIGDHFTELQDSGDHFTELQGFALLQPKSVPMTENTQIIIRLIETFQKFQWKPGDETRFWSIRIIPNVSELQSINLFSSWKQSVVHISSIPWPNSSLSSTRRF